MNQEDVDVDTMGDACEPQLVPEPSSTGLLVAGLAGLMLLASRRARLAAAI